MATEIIKDILNKIIDDAVFNHELSLMSYNRRYYYKHREELKKKSKANYQRNKHSINLRETCDCGAVINFHNIIRHKKTKKHLKRLAEINQYD